MTTEACATPPQDPCCPGCPGFGWFNRDEVERCDDCGHFVDDEAAVKHVVDCASCQQLLGSWVIAEELLKYDVPERAEKDVPEDL